MKRLASISVQVGLAGLLFGGCGGSGSSEPPPAPPPCEVSTKTCYVNGQTGSNSNVGDTPQAALKTIARAAQLALSDYAIIVEAGTYQGEVTTTVIGKTPQNLHFVAHGLVIVDVRGLSGAAGFTLANSSSTVIDGFTILGGSDGGIVIKSHSDGVEIRNCVVSGSNNDGIRVQDSSHALIFDNLVYANAGIGIRVGGTSSGSPNAMLINNTVYGNAARGVEIGTTRAASPNAYVVNNIIQLNGTGTFPSLENLKVETNPRSDLGYSGNHNLIFPASYLPSGVGGIRGANDVNVDAKFVAPGNDFHLAADSPAINHGDLLDASLASLRQFLIRRSTVSGTIDNSGALDIGYHYPP
ncbi:MAG: right-handed parallel beta-helix repeat-containing protein [Deltaproteobacteria bacterium]|nr:right-handed parallel beta-helix repeat-containing protein [Deltaproteobacteria bacterium]